MRPQSQKRCVTSIFGGISSKSQYPKFQFLRAMTSVLAEDNFPPGESNFILMILEGLKTSILYINMFKTDFVFSPCVFYVNLGTPRSRLQRGLNAQEFYEVKC